MLQRLDGRWKKRKVLVGLASAIAIVILLPLGSNALSNSLNTSNWDWTGFGKYTTKQTQEKDSAGKVVKTTEEIQSRKTLWDWLQLVGVPAVLAFGIFWLNHWQQMRAEERERQEQRRVEMDLHEEILQAYLDRISELLTNKELGNQTFKDNPARHVAQARTLAVLRRLGEDGQRKEAILSFLYEAELIQGESPIISLKGADLYRAKLLGAKLGRADLRGAGLVRADLRGADLRGADLTRAKLFRAKLFRADLRGADLHEAILVEADLHEADVSEADLTGAFLSGADLRDAILSGAFLSGDFLSEAGLSKAFLSEVNRSEVNLRDAILSGVTYNVATKFPSGFDPVGAGMVKEMQQKM